MTAHTAVRVLTQGIEAFRLPDRADNVLAQEAGATITASVVERGPDGAAVALSEVMRAAGFADGSGDRSVHPGRMVCRARVEAITRREFTSLG